MDRLEIHDHDEVRGYAARIRYHRGWRRYEMDVRPSDGLALAVRLQAPVYASEELLAAADASPWMASLTDPSQGLFFLHAPRKSASKDGRGPAARAAATSQAGPSPPS
jgi:hypothetical protein